MLQHFVVKSSLNLLFWRLSCNKSSLLSLMLQSFCFVRLILFFSFRVTFFFTKSLLPFTSRILLYHLFLFLFWNFVASFVFTSALTDPKKSPSAGWPLTAFNFFCIFYLSTAAQTSRFCFKVSIIEEAKASWSIGVEITQFARLYSINVGLLRTVNIPLYVRNISSSAVIVK